MIIYVDSCPICGKDITDTEALTYGVCTKCHLVGRFPFEEERKKLSEFESLFQEMIGYPMRDLQRSWAKSLILEGSLPIVSPTGMGKTTFGIVSSVYYVKKYRKKAYIILPTRVLVKEVTEKLFKLSKDVKLVSYTGKKGEKEEISSGNFDILITTGKFLFKNYELLKDKEIGFFFIDDTDSVVKSPKLINCIKEIKTEDAHLILSSATIRPKGKTSLIFREIFGFLPGGTPLPIRNIVDISGPKNSDVLEEIIKTMGRGGLLLFSRGKKEEMEKIVQNLKERGINCEIFEDERQLEDFKEGKIAVLSHIASPYGKLVRGIDLPETIRYVIFYGLPVFSFSLDNSSSMELFLKAVERIVKDRELSLFLDRFSKLPDARKEHYKEKMKEFVKKYSGKEIIDKLSRRFDIIVRDDTIFLPDGTTYIQASGRASRIYNGKLTMGASFVLEDDQALLKALSKTIYTRFGETLDFQNIKDVDLERLSALLDLSRKSGKEIGDVKKILLIVESPTKARTIAGFFGTPTVKTREGVLFYEVFTGEEVLTVSASKGHIYELTTAPDRIEKGGHCLYGICKNGEYTAYFEYIRKCPSCGRQFAHDVKSCPICGNPLVSQKDTADTLRKEAFLADKILLATDPDREGEKISYDLLNNLSLKGIKIERIELHEITKKAFIKAKHNTRNVSSSLIQGYLFRRYEDRWIGFSLSNVLIEKFGRKNLSGGRVQSPVLGWIIERWEKSKKKKRILSFSLQGQKITVDEEEYPFPKTVGECNIKVSKEEKIVSLLPQPPFDTSSLLAWCNRFLKLPASYTMKTAQDLFTNGFITYHRTDSRYISDTGRSVARSYLEMSGLGEYFHSRSWGEPGTHEGIRPTRPMDKDELIRWIKRTGRSISFDGSHFAVYDAIFKRFIASQMKDAKVLTEYLTIFGPWEKELSIERPVKVVDEGFTLIIPPKTYESIEEGEFVVTPEIKKVPIAFPYTQSELIDLMRKKGIGRPSTYAYIIKTLLDRRFVIQRGKNGYLIPTRLGIDVYSFIQERYPDILSEEKTRKMEKTIDLIVEGKISLKSALDMLWEEVGEIERDLSVVDVG